MKQSIEKMRIEYAEHPLEGVDDDPFVQFKMWLQDAVACNVFEPNGMMLATTLDGHPSSRMVLLKQIDKKGFLFFTDYQSRKGLQIEKNSHVSLTFWWKEIYRQVNIEGDVEKVSREISSAYFAKRPKGAQIAATISSQSETVESREELEQRFKQVQNAYRGKKLACPKNWGGYRVIPSRFEFWQGRKNRLHDRFYYVKNPPLWNSFRLSP